MFLSLKLVALLCCFICFSAATDSPDFSSVDCGFHGISEEQCVNKGCVWLAGFAGPWCQKPDSPYIPSIFDLGLGDLVEDQIVLGKYCILTLITLSIASIMSYKKAPMNLDYIYAGILFVIAIIFRFHNIEHPSEVTFDEFYFGAFANSYCNRIFVFDIHPPLAKLTHYFLGSLLGIDCSFNFHGEKGGFDQYNNVGEYVPYRQVSAAFGSVVIPLAYFVGRKFRLSRSCSLLLACFVLCDPLLLSETRLVLTDSQLFFYIVLSIFCALKLWDTETGSRARVLWLVCTAIASGCAFCVKFTALATLGWIAFVTFLAIYTEKKPISFAHCLLASIIAGITFAFPFYFHFLFSQKSADLDWNVDPAHQSFLEGSVYYRESAKQPSFVPHLIYTIKRMLEQNAASLGDHPYASFWYEWIVGRGALLSYSEHKEDEDWHGHVFIVSSVFICYTILVGFAVFFPLAFTMIRSRSTFRLSARETLFLKTGFLMFLGWIANLLPYALVARTTYSYHYLPGQFFGMILVCLLLNEVPFFFLSLFYKGKQLNRLVHKLQLLLVIALMAALLWNFFSYSCFSYGYGVSNVEYAKKKWVVAGL